MPRITMMMWLLPLLLTITVSWALEDYESMLNRYRPIKNSMQGDQGKINLDENIKNEIANIFDIPNTSNSRPSNNKPIVKPTVTSTVVMNRGLVTTVRTTTVKTPCQCVPYHLCDSNYVGVDVNDPNITGVGKIQIRFGQEGCEESVEVCCTIPKTTTNTPVENPPFNNPAWDNPAWNNPTSNNPTSNNPTSNNPTSNNPTSNNPTSNNPTSNTPTSNNPTSNNLKGCGYSNPNGIDFTIVGATNSESQFGEFPWVVALMDILDDSYAGAGALIHPRVVLTAAHIASRYSQGGLKIRAGEWDTKTTKEQYVHQERDVQYYYIHPEYNPENLWNDLAILHLETPVTLDKHINTICLPNQGESFDDTKNCVANGWGKDHFGKNVGFAVILKKLEIDIVEQSRCNMLLRRTRLGIRYNLHSSFVCAGGEEGKDMCTGDGGGPLACPIGNNRFKLAGLVVGGIGCGKKDVPGLYASLSAFRSWIDEKMKMFGYGTSSYTI